MYCVFRNLFLIPKRKFQKFVKRSGEVKINFCEIPLLHKQHKPLNIHFVTENSGISFTTNFNLFSFLIGVKMNLIVLSLSSYDIHFDVRNAQYFFLFTWWMNEQGKGLFDS